MADDHGFDLTVVTQSVRGGIGVDVTVDPRVPAAAPRTQATVER